MTQEEERLLLVDLLPRILHGIKIHHYQGADCVLKSIDLRTHAAYVEVYDFIALKEFIEDGQRSIFEYKPYLRPMSSMTEEEKDELKQISSDYLDKWEKAETSIERWKLDGEVSFNRSVFYNSHHLDWIGLIPMGIALEAKEDMYKIE